MSLKYFIFLFIGITIINMDYIWLICSQSDWLQSQIFVKIFIYFYSNIDCTNTKMLPQNKIILATINMGILQPNKPVIKLEKTNFCCLST